MIVRQYAPCNLGRNTICLGKQGEINALRVEFDVSAWMAMYPEAAVKLMHFAPDRPQDNPVIPTLGVEGTTRVWIVGKDDTANSGNGVIELLLIDERTGSTIKSATGYTTVLHSPSAGIEAQEAEAGYVRYDIDQSALLTDEQKAVARKNIGAGTGDGTGSGTGGITVEKDPTVPDWAKQPSRPPYTAGEVGARPDTWMPSASDVGADAAGTAAAQVGAHNVSGAAHADMRALIEGLTSRLNALADSDDKTLDQLSEIVAYIKSNKALIDAVTTGKVSTSDIVDNLTTNASSKVLSAAQGVRLKALIDAIVIPDKLPNPQPLTINGQSYDGSAKVEVTVTGEGGGANINDTTPSSTTTYSSQKIESELNALNQANATQDTRLTALEQAGGIVTIEPADDDIPKVFFTGTAPTSKDEGELPLEMEYISKTLMVKDYVTLKVQGDSSAGYPKKNFNLKMFSDADRLVKDKRVFRDWAETNKYTLKANWIDHTHARNVVGGRLWGKIARSRTDYSSYPPDYIASTNCGAVDGFPVKVYLNGIYQGLYTWNIRKDESMFNMDSSLGVQAALIADAGNAVTAWQAIPSIDGTDWTDELNDVVPDAVKTSFQAAYSFVMDSTDDEFKSNIETYFYLSSLIDYYIYIYVILMIGGTFKSQTMLTYDSVKWLANIYDMDTTWALHWNGGSFYDPETPCPEGYEAATQGYTNRLYARLVALFPDVIKTRYAELRRTVLSAANIINEYERFMDVIPSDLYAEDFASTTAGGAFTEIPSKATNTLQKLRDVIVTRLAYCDAEIPKIGEEVVDIPCTGITLDQTELTFTGAGTQTLTATVTPSDTTDTVVWSTSDDTVATVDSGVVTAKGNGSTTITATCGAYSATCAVSVSVVEEVAWEQGTISGSGENVDDVNRIRTSGYLNAHTLVSASTVDGYQILAACYDSNKSMIGYWIESSSSLSLTGTYADTSSIMSARQNGVEYVRIVMKKTDNSIISVDAGSNVIYDYGTPCTGITLDKTALMFDGAGTQTLTATVTPTDTTDAVIWSSDNGIATVRNGIVTAIGNGSATVTVTCGAYSATCSVSVSGIDAPYPLTNASATVSGVDIEVSNGNHVKITAESEVGLTSGSNGLLVDCSFPENTQPTDGSYNTIESTSINTTWFDVLKGSNVRIEVSNLVVGGTVYQATMGLRKAARSNVISSFNIVTNSTITGTTYIEEVASETASAKYLLLYFCAAAGASIEFDVSITVDGVKYV